MPQINRIRVNNVKYNFGTQYYDDFMMNFSCRNAIYDLANGGGKSVLMLLLLQTVIPNCTLDDKQPVEKLFRMPGGSSVIHSLVEWKLDPGYRKDGYQYMTTGFCARKGRDNGEDNQREASGIEYFNYCIFYRQFGDNDIRNLPLSTDGERITYNGLKSYLRNLDKNDLSVMVKIFERKSDYQNFISEYGLFESHWEIIRGINRTEGHVRTYFESNYRTARKVVEDLLIEEIIQKSYNSRIRSEGDDEDMAKTLIDIKDKLMELSGKKEQIHLYDRQIEALKAFSEKISSFKEIIEKKAALREELTDYLLKCRRLIADTKVTLESLRVQQKDLADKENCEKKNIAAAKIMEEQKSLAALEAEAGQCQKTLDVLYAKEKEYSTQLALMESAGDYQDYLNYRQQRDEVAVAIENGMRDRNKVSEELYGLAAAKYNINRRMSDKVAQEKAAIEKAYEEAYAQYEEISKAVRESDIRIAVLESNIASCSKKSQEARNNLVSLMTQCDLVVADGLEQELSYEKETKAAMEKKLEEDTEKLATVVQEREAAAGALIIAKADIKRLESHMQACEALKNEYISTEEKLGSLKKVYECENAQQLLSSVNRVYREQLKKAADIQETIEKLNNYINGLKSGQTISEGKQYIQTGEYLRKTYAGDVVSGRKWYESLSENEKADIISRVPFIEYAYVIKNDFERIRNDKGLKKFLNCSYIIPVVSENILSSGDRVMSDDIVFGMQDMSYLKAGNGLEQAIAAAVKELEEKTELKQREESRLADIEQDYSFITRNAGKNEKLLEKCNQQSEEAAKELEDARRAADELEGQTAGLNMAYERYTEDIQAGQKNIAGVSERIVLIEKTISARQQSYELEEEKNRLNKEISDYTGTHKQDKEKEICLKEKLEKAELDRSRIDAEIEERNIKFADIYAPYYIEGRTPAGEELTEEELDARFMGLRAVVESNATDMKDKHKLIKTYEEAMDKCIRAIEYRGHKAEDISEKFRSKQLHPASGKQLARMKEELSQTAARHSHMTEEYNARNAQINRIEGSISHAVSQLEAMYGAYEPFECDNIQEYVAAHQKQLEKLTSDIKAVISQTEKVSQTLGEYTLMERDIIRVTRNAGIELPENMISDESVSAESVAGYENAEKQLAALTRYEASAREGYMKSQQELVQLLYALQAPDLADEISKSVYVPETTADIGQLVRGISEINSCIELERDGISSGIEDMEKIKDSFENRCIQTCVNIRTELDRLPQLSKIRLDDEEISMIGLNIPYVKEEQFKERMALYIDETVSGAEHMRTVDEKMKYIKGRLAWKKLFSVIVTDMNQIKLQLYKRERLGTQSRYLRYEEAVGSTGQSQGIYIQFLIAVINYIASIHAAGRDISVMGKTIFIDNPFGAAKDVYIWEPIFKMLATNHVQLIVPARGATPAITGRFDVNYILGQKLSGNMLQTVVTDYMSRVKTENMEYTRLSYEQNTLFD